MDFQERSIIYARLSSEDFSSHGFIFRMTAADAVVLDVGCACGDVGKLLHKEKNCLMTGMEYNPFSVAAARETGAFEQVHEVNLETFSAKEWPQYEKHFDFILFGDVLEHLREPQNTLSEMKRLLKPEGEIFISLPNAAHAAVKANLLTNDFHYTDSGLLDCTHIHFFTWKTIAEMLTSLSLEITEAHGIVGGRNWSQPKDPLDELPFACRRWILKDLHSWIIQYVMKIRLSELPESVLLQKNTAALQFTKESLAPNIYFYNDRSHYYKALYVPVLRKILRFFFPWKKRP